MKREWEIDTDFFKGLAFAWTSIGFLAVFISGVVYRNHDRHGHDTGAAWVHSPLHLILPIWLAPIALFASALICGCVLLGVDHLWHHPPIRRVTKPVTTDLRKVKK